MTPAVSRFSRARVHSPTSRVSRARSVRSEVDSCHPTIEAGEHIDDKCGVDPPSEPAAIGDLGAP